MTTNTTLPQATAVMISAPAVLSTTMSQTETVQNGADLPLMTQHNPNVADHSFITQQSSNVVSILRSAGLDFSSA